VRVERVDRLLTGTLCRIGRELVAGTDERVDRLPAGRVAGIEPGEFLVRYFEHYVPR
jgi:hypothetical protein